jgi:hypothetical protein
MRCDWFAKCYWSFEKAKAQRMTKESLSELSMSTTFSNAGGALFV